MGDGQRSTAAAVFRRVHESAPLPELLADASRREEMALGLAAGDVFIVRNAVPAAWLHRVRDWLIDVGRNSLPAWHPIAAGAPNSHRVNRWDTRSYVKGCFHQFVFFPWNQDPFGLFDVVRPVFQLRNLLSGHRADTFLGPVPENGCTARLAFQYYPRGAGALHTHCDPVGPHQLAVPSIICGRKGVDFEHGGLYVADGQGRRLELDADLDWGDAVFLNAALPHGVAPIDPDADEDWLSFQGRWMLLAAVNKIEGNSAIADSRDMEAG